MMEAFPAVYLEACVTSLAHALHAASAGAHRLEFCSRLETEGMTPDFELAKEILYAVHIPVRIMIRESEVGFASDAGILWQMKKRIEQFKALNPDGFVLGVLYKNQIAQESMLELMKMCAPYPITFHKALDLVTDLQSDLNWLNQFPQVDTLLTSGGAVSAVEGIDRIRLAKQYFKRNVMAGGRITPQNLPNLHAQLQLNWYHGRNICNDLLTPTD